ncbi:MAG: Gfo/Idh/MocA family oxidoreductase [Bacteroidales bacterium]|jgi:UDP-N-acetyl-2-amino-2-deoxyglucuronate dehydrogenase|nr:Gfo/Idh/MocA family oxidoreductase [Bacteroidales bacterium]HOL98187.1 Gfo/Idh/MocA family oxidoreductase [Bacteroidales bacterium]HOM36410.1 Gfo/Idh/MocA family oxidoreductase [Bacteroidales bacterium]HPD23916.1 Gfo/Idh/MocA family oxidoreductase [Bacteroidales bacterium]HRS99987.1 Gfo/Idh/MocA family oxidoreductase [Bacteroidales bacterium]
MAGKNFALIGVAGYIAVRHVKAIKETGNNLVATLDPFDSVGFLDSYFPEADFFHEFERFDRHIYKLSQTDKKIDYVSICSPNYLHDAHIRFALRNKADAICEKPLVLNPWNVDALKELEKETGKKIYNILQLRLHPSIIELKKKIEEGPKDKIYDIDLAYITSRGKWYHYSWKGDVQKSGGIATNIGVHFFDMLTWIFGSVKNSVVHHSSNETTAGFLQLERANVRWILSINYDLVPENIKAKGQRTYRCIMIEGNEIEFSEGFTDLHTEIYKNILAGKGFGLDEARTAIQTVYDIRNAIPVGKKGDFHPLLQESF